MLTISILGALALLAPPTVHAESKDSNQGDKPTPCLFSPLFEGDALYTGAVSDQELPLRLQTSCTLPDSRTLQEWRAIYIAPENEPGSRITAYLKLDETAKASGTANDPPSFTLRIDQAIPAKQWPRAGSLWRLSDVSTEKSIAMLSITALPIEPTLTKLQVLYEPNDKAWARIARFLNKTLARAREAEPARTYRDAYASPDPRKDAPIQIRNIAEFSGLDDFPTRSREVDGEEEHWAVNPAEISGLGVFNTNRGGQGSEKNTGDLRTPCGDSGASNCTRIEDISAIGFHMDRESDQPLSIDLYYTRSRSGGKPGSKPARHMRLRVQLATNARLSAVPFPLTSLAYVECSTNRLPSYPALDIAENGQTLAVNDYVINRDDCSLVIPQHRIDAELKRELGAQVDRLTCPMYTVHRFKKVHRKHREAVGARDDSATKGPKDARAPEKPTSTEDNKDEKIQDLPLKEQCILERLPPNASYMRPRSKVLADADPSLETVKTFLGTQQLVYQITHANHEFTEESDPNHQQRPIELDLGSSQDIRIPLTFGEQTLGETEEFEIRLETRMSGDDLDKAASEQAEKKRLCQDSTRCFRARVRSKGRFGVRHTPGSRGSAGVRIFATIPLDFVSFRFPPSGRDATSTADSNIAQVTTLNTGLLLALEPWNYITNRNMFALPFRFLFGGMVHRWQQAKFEPSLFTGLALALPLFKGLDANDRVSFDLTLSLGWELGLIRGPGIQTWDGKHLTEDWKKDFRSRNHFVIAVGLNVFALFSPKTAAR